MDSKADVEGTCTRRQVLRLGGVSLTAASLTGCNLLSTDPTGGGGENGSNGNGGNPKEAPSLTEAVRNENLPPVEERLPSDPMVIEPTDRVGSYGGDLRLLLGGVGGEELDTTIGYENLLRYERGATQLTEDFVIPNVAESVEIGSNGAEYTFKLRPGMKWSDGEPFTADDIVFWYEDVAINEELRPVFIDWLDTGGDTPLVVEKADDHTVVFKFSEPNGLFLINVATQRGIEITSFPAHYMRQFHKNYADDIEQQVEDAGRDNWIDHFENKASLWENPERPTLNAWLMTSVVDASTQRPVAERNPYYWKVDSEGSQLPYIDRVVYNYYEEEEPAVLMVTNGEIDVEGGGIGIADLRNKPVFARSREEGNYDFFETIPQNMNQMVLMLNMTHQDQVLREVFSNKDFRVGLSYAINRQEIIDTVYQRQGEPWQAAPRPESPYFNEELAKQYTEFDPELANEHLDRVVPDKRDDGIRLRPDGSPLSFQIDVITDQSTRVDALELIRGTWLDVGVDMRVKNEHADLFFNRMEANLHDGAVWEGAGGLGAPLDPFYWVPHNFNTRYAMPWHFWLLDPEDDRAEEPPPDAMRQIELYEQMLTTGDREERESLMQQIIDNSIDLFYCMGVALQNREYAIVSNRLGNTSEVSAIGWLHARLAPTNFHQYFIAD